MFPGKANEKPNIYQAEIMNVACKMCSRRIYGCLENHLSSRCKVAKKTIYCNWCDQIVKKNSIFQHLDVCEKYRKERQHYITFGQFLGKGNKCICPICENPEEHTNLPKPTLL